MRYVTPITRTRITRPEAYTIDFESRQAAYRLLASNFTALAEAARQVHDTYSGLIDNLTWGYGLDSMPTPQQKLKEAEVKANAAREAITTGAQSFRELCVLDKAQAQLLKELAWRAYDFYGTDWLRKASTSVIYPIEVAHRRLLRRLPAALDAALRHILFTEYEERRMEASRFAKFEAYAANLRERAAKLNSLEGWRTPELLTHAKSIGLKPGNLRNAFTLREMIVDAELPKVMKPVDFDKWVKSKK